MKISRIFFQKIRFCICIYFKIHIPQGSVATQLRCGGIFNNYLIANCPQNVPVKVENRSIFGEDIYNDSVGSFFETQCIISKR